jgi:hypothetical protein
MGQTNYRPMTRIDLSMTADYACKGEKGGPDEDKVIKVQTRRTISVGRALLERWQAFCAGKAPVSALTEFVVEHRIAAEWTESDAVALNAWLGARTIRYALPYSRVEREPRAPVDPDAPLASYHERRRRITKAAKRAAATDRARAALAANPVRIARIEQWRKINKARQANPGQQICHTCFEPGHRTNKCPTIDHPARGPSKGELAAQLAYDERLSFGEAAKHLGITRQRVQQGWVKLFGDRISPRAESQAAANTEREARIAEALHDGKTVDEIQAATGEPRDRIRFTARRLDIAAVTDSDLRFERGLALVAEGKTYAQAAAEAGVSKSRLSDMCRREGIRSTNKPGRNRGAGRS